MVTYLKACQLAVQKVIAGTPLSSLNELTGEGPWPRLDRSGLPVIIPTYDRRLIRAGSASVIRYWLTLFSLYRVLKVDGKLKINTITDPCSVPIHQVREVGWQLEALAAKYKSKFPLVDGWAQDVLLLESASSTSKVS